MPVNSPAPIVPAPTASDLPRNERRLIKRLRGLTLFSKFSSKGRFSLLLESFAVGSLSVFMPVESQQFTTHAAREKLRVCYLTGSARSHVIQPNKCFLAACDVKQARYVWRRLELVYSPTRLQPVGRVGPNAALTKTLLFIYQIAVCDVILQRILRMNSGKNAKPA